MAGWSSGRHGFWLRGAEDLIRKIRRLLLEPHFDAELHTTSLRPFVRSEMFEMGKSSERHKHTFGDSHESSSFPLYDGRKKTTNVLLKPFKQSNILLSVGCTYRGRKRCIPGQSSARSAW